MSALRPAGAEPRLVKPGTPPRQENVVPGAAKAGQAAKPAPKAAPGVDYSNLQCAVTKLVLQKLEENSTKVLGAVIQTHGVMFVHATHVQGKPIDGKFQYKAADLTHPNLRKQAGNDSVAGLTGSEFIAAMQGGKHPNVTKMVPTKEDAVKEIASLKPHQKSFYDSIMRGVGHAFFVPDSDKETVEALAKLNLPNTLKRIAGTLDVKEIKKADLYTAKIVQRVVIDAAKEYAPKDFKEAGWNLDKIAEIATASL